MLGRWQLAGVAYRGVRRGERLSRAIMPLVDLLVPRRCANCHASLREADGNDWPGRPERWAESPRGYLCDDCLAALLDPRDRCSRCGEPGVAQPHRGCGQRVVREIAVLGGYDGDLRLAVLRSKHPSGVGLAGALGRLWTATHFDRCRDWGVDAVVPVPMHWMRRLRRGGSSVDSLADAVAVDLCLPVVHGLKRWRFTPMQNELPRADRKANVAGAFRTVGRKLAGRRVLLVDDVVTTGATLASCASVAIQGGAVAVFAAAIAKADGSA